jgi:plasmid stabilization system protein ParE
LLPNLKTQKETELHYIKLNDNRKQPQTAVWQNGPELKGKRTLKHVIFYRVMDDQSIEIARIRHERMNLKNK